MSTNPQVHKRGLNLGSINVSPPSANLPSLYNRFKQHRLSEDVHEKSTGHLINRGTFPW
jgi:hypothetical protein